MNKPKDLLLSVTLTLLLLIMGGAVLYPLVLGNISGLSTRFNPQYCATLFLALAVAVGFVTCLDVPERIRRSKHLTGQALLIIYLAIFLYFVFGFSGVIERYGAISRVSIIIIVTTFGLWSIVRVIRYALAPST